MAVTGLQGCGPWLLTATSGSLCGCVQKTLLVLISVPLHNYPGVSQRPTTAEACHREKAFQEKELVSQPLAWRLHHEEQAVSSPSTAVLHGNGSSCLKDCLHPSTDSWAAGHRHSWGKDLKHGQGPVEQEERRHCLSGSRGSVKRQHSTSISAGERGSYGAGEGLL